MRDAGDIQATVVLVAADGSETIVGQLAAPAPSLALVDVLARGQLAAGRRGARLGLRDASASLRELLELVGLVGLLVLKTRGEAELGKQGGVEEVVQPGDPAG